MMSLILKIQAKKFVLTLFLFSVLSTLNVNAQCNTAFDLGIITSNPSSTVFSTSNNTDYWFMFRNQSNFANNTLFFSLDNNTQTNEGLEFQLYLNCSSTPIYTFTDAPLIGQTDFFGIANQVPYLLDPTTIVTYYIKVKRIGAPSTMPLTLKLQNERCPDSGFTLIEDGNGINVYDENRVWLDECVGAFPVSTNYIPNPNVTRRCDRLVCNNTKLKFTFDEGFWLKRRYIPEFSTNVNYIWTVKYDDLNPGTANTVTSFNVPLWNTQGMSFGNMPTFDYTFTNSGVYTISYVIFGNDFPCGYPEIRNSKSFTIYVGKPNVNINPTTTAPYCAGQQICFDPLSSISPNPNSNGYNLDNSIPNVPFDPALSVPTFSYINGVTSVYTANPIPGAPYYLYSWKPNLCGNFDAGTHILTFTSENKCGISTQTTTITVAANPLMLSHTNNCTKTINFNANIINPACIPSNSSTNYYWNFGDGAGNFIGSANYSHNFGSNGIYNVSVIYQGYEATTQVVIDQISIPTITGSLIACANETNGGEVYSASIADFYNSYNQYTYAWSVTGGTIDNSTPSTGTFFPANQPINVKVNWAIGSPNLGGTVTLNVTSSNGCVYSKILNVEPCCNQGKVITTTTKISELYPGTNSTSNAIISINAPLLIDNDFTCTNCKFVMGNSQTIEILPTVSGPAPTQLQLIQSNVYACDKMWDYILAPSDKTKIRVEQTFIEDGKNALQSKNGGDIEAINSTFNKNLHAIVISDYGIHPLEVRGCVFTCKDGVTAYTKPGSMLRAPYSANVGFAGIRTTNVTQATIGDRTSTTYLNTFENTQHGIYSLNSNLRVYNNLFQDIVQPKNTKERHIAIYSKGDIKIPTGLTIGGNLKRENNTFLNCDYGVIAENNNDLYIAYNSFININYYAINYFKNIDKEDVKITNNSFTDVSVGVFAHDNPISTNKINNNLFTQTTHGAGIYAGEVAVLVSEPSKSASAVYTINSNDIKWFAEGIHLSVVQGAKVNNNNIRLSQNQQEYGYGVYAEYNTSLTAHDNSVIFMGGNAQPYYKGFYIATTTNSTYTCNSAEKLEDGFYFEEDNNGTVLKTTSFSRNINHLHISGNSGLIGQQGSLYISASNKAKVNDNNFTPGFGNVNQTYTSNSADGSSSPFYVRNSPFQLNPTANNSAQFTPVLKTVYSNSQISHPRLNCNVVLPPPGGLANGGNRDLAHKIAKGLINYPLQAAGNQQSKQNLLAAIKAEPSFVIGDTVLTQFNDSMQLAPWGQMTQALALMADSTQAFDSARVAQASSTVQAQNANTVMETNFKQVNQIWLQALQNNNLLDSAQQQVIRTMAWLCPITEGPAVYQARAIIHAYDSVYVNYRNACEAYSAPIVYARGLNQEETTNDDNTINNNIEAETLYTQVYPNPTTNVFNVAILTNMPQNVSVSVYNMMGELIETQETVTNSKAISFNLQGYAQGLYLCKITNQNGEVLETKKVFIQHD